MQQTLNLKTYVSLKWNRNFVCQIWKKYTTQPVGELGHNRLDEERYVNIYYSDTVTQNLNVLLTDMLSI